MSNAITFARPYARAAFASAQGASRVPQWSAALGFAAAVAADPRIEELLGDPRPTAADKIALLLPEGGADEGFQAFLGLLAENGRLDVLPEISALFEQQRAEADRVVKATVTSAVRLDDADLARLKASLKARFGREVELTPAVDESLIAGAVIDAGDVVIDGSLRSKLARLESALAH
ncbi:F0F1 ATP synthase subunit delta [Coralloluteibacterium stylophorae]|uniref:ATP synthase subunit delta n=1 Tax=Coralloluteibacterium stylophorae TaxID=1776034 RepID=A0A8J7VV23_9GAMM|nr:F0F1 ATP synthase subunit delta [Coralloluteibacterium stylophorae]MBS7457990.1 F0F1 ATP synthase subunit delta [Coralloluteibacterium stylophorae]